MPPDTPLLPLFDAYAMPAELRYCRLMMIITNSRIRYAALPLMFARLLCAIAGELLFAMLIRRRLFSPPATTP